ncbi:hypothetical protein MAY82_18985 (plasmid) [Edwardsiella ictaluri]|nr:hypothetical protein [Edwardsiella ictaluri]WFO14470.1 hypothetical protein MAY82_18985 [Edwardsiella ictaluri]
MKLITTVSLNMLLAFMIPLGIVMMGDTRWGVIIMMIPVIFWGGRFLLFVHKSKWAAGLFWLGITYLQWQVAIGILCAFWSFCLLESSYAQKRSTPNSPHHVKMMRTCMRYLLTSQREVALVYMEESVSVMIRKWEDLPTSSLLIRIFDLRCYNHV